MIVDQSEGRGQIGFPTRHDTGLKKWKNNKYIGPKGKKTTWKQLLIKPKKRLNFLCHTLRHKLTLLKIHKMKIRVNRMLYEKPHFQSMQVYRKNYPGLKTAAVGRRHQRDLSVGVNTSLYTD